MNSKIILLALFAVSQITFAAVPSSLEVSHAKFSFQVSEKKNVVQYKTREVRGKIDTAKCEKNFLKDIWLIYSFKKDNLRPYQQSKKDNPAYIKVTENKKTYFVSQTSELGMFLSKMPNTLRNLDLREKRLCKK